MQAFVNQPQSSERIEWTSVPHPTPTVDEVLIEVKAFSINRGELSLMNSRPAGWRPGQDVAGVVVRPAKNGQGPQEGERVAALLEGGGWAEYAAVPLERLAPIPAQLTYETAAALPLAGLTAAALLRSCPLSLGDRILTTGASGGVGSLLVQLARQSGLNVTAVSKSEHEGWLRDLGANNVVSDVSHAGKGFDCVLESVGGMSLQAAFKCVRPGGRIISYGNSSAADAAFNLFSFFGAENAMLQTFFSYRSFDPLQIGLRLRDLLVRAEDGTLQVVVSTFEWEQITAALARLQERGSRGKIVLSRP
jgi:NADPH2:quinone reductase